MSRFNELFIQYTSSILLKIDEIKLDYKSRLGGMPPSYFDDKTTGLDGYCYLLTLSDDFSDFIQGRDLSVFIPKEYDNYGPKPFYPYLNVKCFLHAHSSISTLRTDLKSSILAKSSLVPIIKEPDTKDEEHDYYIKIGSTPYLLQEEAFFYEELDNKDYHFIFQLDENGLTEPFIKGDYPFGFGAVYFYGIIDETEEIGDVVAGFWQK